MVEISKFRTVVEQGTVGKFSLKLEKTKAVTGKNSLSVTIGPTTVKLVNIELKKTLSNAEKKVPFIYRKMFHC